MSKTFKTNVLNSCFKDTRGVCWHTMIGYVFARYSSLELRNNVEIEQQLVGFARAEWIRRGLWCHLIQFEPWGGMYKALNLRLKFQFSFTRIDWNALH